MMNSSRDRGSSLGVVLGGSSVAAGLVVLAVEVGSGSFRDKELPMELAIGFGLISVALFLAFIFASCFRRWRSRFAIVIVLAWLCVAIGVYLLEQLPRASGKPAVEALP